MMLNIRLRSIAAAGLLLAFGVACGASVHTGRAQEKYPVPQFTAVDLIIVEPEDPIIQELRSRGFPDPGLLFVFDTQEFAIKALAVAGKSEITSGELVIPRGAGLRMASASVLKFDVNPSCTWVKFDGTSILVAGNPADCKRT
jgi:hypothetical protein